MRAKVTWPDVVKALQDDESRRFVMSRYNASGWCPDDFARRVEARSVLADALSRTEDILETKRGSNAATERLRIRTVRRRLELELYP